MKSVVIRADSSSELGTGHIRRDLVLAKREFPGRRVVFAVRDLPGNINAAILAEGFEVALLASNETSELLTLLEKTGADMLVLDHYDIGIAQEREIARKAQIPIFVIDDLYAPHHCDILLNHNLYAEPARYEGLVPDHCEIRCGIDHMLLRDEFFEAQKKIARPTRPSGRVFVAMGGTDHLNLSARIVEVLQNFPGLYADVVTSSANPRLEKLENALRTFGRRHTLHVDSDRIARLMAACDFAIVSPSVILNEIVFMQRPFIAIQTADNQREMADYLVRHRLPLLEAFDAEALEREVAKMVRQTGEAR